jgi:hypothetical protein
MEQSENVYENKAQVQNVAGSWSLELGRGVSLTRNCTPEFQSSFSLHGSTVYHRDFLPCLEAAGLRHVTDQHRIPVEREAIACFAHAPGTLDFYIWLAWRTWTLNGRQWRIPLFGPDGLCQQLGTSDYSAQRFFRRKLRHWLKQVKLVWPDCPAAMANGRDALVVRSSKTSPAIHTLP